MRSTRLRYCILLLLVLAPILLNACAFGSGSSDPPVTPDTTIPPTLQVTASIAEDQDASDGAHGMSVITLAFNTNETVPPSQVIFVNGESVSCKNNNQTNSITLGNFTSYWFRVAISSLPFTYKCDYHYPLNGKIKTSNIFIFDSPHKPLSPVLQRPVNNSNFEVSYNPGNPSPNTKTCTVQVTANAPNGTVTGSTVSQATVSQGRKLYTGPDVSSLDGLGNIVMTRTCTPINIHNNSAECSCPPGTKFASVNVTYTSTASYEVSWVPSGSATQGTNS
jgi:hypothetical protein